MDWLERYSYIKMIDFAHYGHSKNEIKINSDLSNYATKSDLKTQQVSSIHQNLPKRMM